MIFDKLCHIFFGHVLPELCWLRCHSSDVSLLLNLMVTFESLSTGRRRDVCSSTLLLIITCTQAIVYALSVADSFCKPWRRQAAIVGRHGRVVTVLVVAPALRYRWSRCGCGVCLRGDVGWGILLLLVALLRWDQYELRTLIRRRRQGADILVVSV